MTRQMPPRRHGPSRAVAVCAVLGSAVVLGLAACSSDGASTDSSAGTAGQNSPAGSGSTERPFQTEQVATFEEPWALEFLPGTPYLAVTQRGGELLLLDTSSGDTMTVDGVPQVLAEGQGGLGDIVAAPGFDGSANRTVYLSWAEAGDGDTAGAVVARAQLVVSGEQARLDGIERVWEQAQKVSGRGHYSHRIAFSPDGQYLFISSGDRQKMDPAQDPASGLGAIVRLRPDGTPAPDNPMAADGGAAAQVWSHGHRNVLGLAFDADGRLWASEMGPQGGDELNLVRKGGNYGWPKASNGSHYGGGEIPDHGEGDGFVAPSAWWTPSVSPAGLMIYQGERFAAWRGDAFLAALSGRALIRVDLDGENATTAQRWDMQARIRDVAQAPDGSIYLVQDGSGAQLLRLTPTG